MVEFLCIVIWVSFFVVILMFLLLSINGFKFRCCGLVLVLIMVGVVDRSSMG